MVVFECAYKLTRLYSMSVYCLEYRGKSRFRILDGKMDQYQYTSVLDTKMLPFARRDFKSKCVFQDGNAPAH